MPSRKFRIPAVLAWTALHGVALGASVACGGETTASCPTCRDGAVADRSAGDAGMPGQPPIPDGAVVDEGLPDNIVIL